MKKIEKEYFEWLKSLINRNDSEEFAFDKLLKYLYSLEFIYSNPMDSNRAGDGMAMRGRYILSHPNTDDLLLILTDKKCSVFEMMVGLSVRIEETIMDNTEFGNRTSQWFWGMVNNLGLGAMYDTRFDERYVKRIIDDFSKHKYDKDGKGGLFTVRGTKEDLRENEIWVQMLWYLDSIS